MTVRKRKRVKFTAISDTHTMHDKIHMMYVTGDVLIHSGDSTFLGQPNEVYPFIDWMSKQKFKYKVFIAGNHDFGFEDKHKGFNIADRNGNFYFRGKILQKGLGEEYREYCKKKGVIYLENEEVTLFGYRIYGSPYQPEFCGWAFQYPLDKADIHWCPSSYPNMDILVTHGPPYGYLDNNHGFDTRCGCKALREFVEVKRPLVHIFGHIHGSYGKSRNKHTKFINAAICNEQYAPIRKPINFQLPVRTDELDS